MSDSVTPGPYKIVNQFNENDPEKIVAEVVEYDRATPEEGFSIVTERHTVSEGEPEQNAELILAAFNVAHALRDSDESAAAVIQEAARIVAEKRDEEEEDEESDEVWDPVPRGPEVEQALDRSDDEQALAVASDAQNNIAVFLGQASKSLALSREEAKSFAGQLLNHARGLHSNGT